MKPIEWPSIPELSEAPNGSGLKMALKRDGSFVQLTRDWIKGRRIDSATGDYIDYTDLLAPSFEIAKLPEGTLLVGEYVVLDADGLDDFPATVSVLNSAQPPRRRRSRIVLFDAAWIAGYDVRSHPQHERMELVRQVVNRCPLPGVDTVAEMAYDADRYDRIVEAGHEGVVVKDPHARFGEGMWKLKGRREYTVRLGDFEYGDGEISDRAGAFYMEMQINGRWVHAGKVGTGFSQRERKLLMDRVPVEAKVEALGMSEDGKLRQPSFKEVLS
ncbi:MAG: hypothetical protein ABEL51_04610 [Salinibacter sp.]